jgi:hypothetical protein
MRGSAFSSRGFRPERIRFDAAGARSYFGGLLLSIAPRF